MNKIFQIGLTAAAIVAAVPAQATDFILDLTSSGLGTPSSTLGNAYTYKMKTGTETIDVTVTGWSRQLDNSIRQATLASWGSNGLGIYQNGESTGGTLHQIDNVNGWEFLSVQFSKQVSLVSGVLNAYTLPETDWNGNPVRDRNGNIVYRNYTDNDAYIGWGNSGAAWNSNLGLNNYNWSNVSGALSGSTNTDSNGTAAQTFKLAGATGNTWLIGGSINGPDGLNDAFKLAQLTVRTVSAVPEPATWAMMLVGFGMVAGAARYRRRKTGAVFA